VLQSVAVCCSVLQCVAVCCSVLQCVAVFAIYTRTQRPTQQAAIQSQTDTHISILLHTVSSLNSMTPTPHPHIPRLSPLFLSLYTQTHTHSLPFSLSKSHTLSLYLSHRTIQYAVTTGRFGWQLVWRCELNPTLLIFKKNQDETLLHLFHC